MTAFLDHVSIKGFKSISQVDQLELRPINVVIGPNGSGKSNFIGVFAFLHELTAGRLQSYVAKVGGADKLLHFGSKSSKALRIHLSFKDAVNQYAIELIPSGSDELIPREEIVSFWDKARYQNPYNELISSIGKEAGISSPKLERTAGFVRKCLDSWRVYHFHDTSWSSPMKQTTDIHDNRYLRPDGGNLSAFLYFLQQKHRDSYELIRSTVQRVTPFFDDFHLEPLQLNQQKMRLEWKHKDSDKYFDASSLSDGTLRFMALTTLLAQPEMLRPSVILVDEPELGLHPFAIAMLASLVKAASKMTQVIISTQSPLLLDHFSPEDILVSERIKGATQFMRPDAAKLTAWLEDYSLGQLWEKNQLGGRPSNG